MIKKQYDRMTPGYFKNFIDNNNFIVEGIKPYKATLAKSKNKNYKLNVKWHDEKLYALFVLKWS